MVKKTSPKKLKLKQKYIEDLKSKIEIHKYEEQQDNVYNNTWKNDEVTKIAFRAAEIAYGYDLDLISSITGKKIYDEIFLEAVQKFRSNDLNREDIELFNKDGKVRNRLEYKSSNSSDQLAVFSKINHDETTLVFGFRGTDTVDPMRFLGYIPHDYEIHWRQLIQDFGEEKYLQLPNFAPSFCGCKDLCNIEPYSYKSQFVEATTKRYGFLGIATSGSFLIKPIFLPAHNMTSRDNKHLFSGGSRDDRSNCSQANIVGLGLPYLKGVRGSCIAAKFSDFNSDAILAGGLFDFEEKNEESFAIIKDEKHERAASEIVSVYESFKLKAEEDHEINLRQRHAQKAPTIIVCGHSLGGSLAFYAYLTLKRYLSAKDGGRDGWFSAPQVYFRGFNAALLENFDRLDFPKKYLINALHIRNENDIVSFGIVSGLGNLIPTQSFKMEKKASHYISSGDTLTHGLEAFKKCKGEVVKTYNEIKK